MNKDQTYKMVSRRVKNKPLKLIIKKEMVEEKNIFLKNKVNNFLLF